MGTHRNTNRSKHRNKGSGCMGGILSVFDFPKPHSGRKLLVDKKRRDGTEAPRNSLEVSVESTPQAKIKHEDKPYAYQMKIPAEKKKESDATMKSLIAEEISKGSDVKKSPSIVARLMGLETMPKESMTKPHFKAKETYPQKRKHLNILSKSRHVPDSVSAPFAEKNTTILTNASPANSDSLADSYHQTNQERVQHESSNNLHQKHFEEQKLQEFKVRFAAWQASKLKQSIQDQTHSQEEQLQEFKERFAAWQMSKFKQDTQQKNHSQEEQLQEFKERFAAWQMSTLKQNSKPIKSGDKNDIVFRNEKVNCPEKSSELVKFKSDQNSYVKELKKYQKQQRSEEPHMSHNPLLTEPSTLYTSYSKGIQPNMLKDGGWQSLKSPGKVGSEDASKYHNDSNQDKVKYKKRLERLLAQKYLVDKEEYKQAGALSLENSSDSSFIDMENHICLPSEDNIPLFPTKIVVLKPGKGEQQNPWPSSPCCSPQSVIGSNNPEMLSNSTQDFLLEVKEKLQKNLGEKPKPKSRFYDESSHSAFCGFPKDSRNVVQQLSRITTASLEDLASMQPTAPPQNDSTIIRTMCYCSKSRNTGQDECPGATGFDIAMDSSTSNATSTPDLSFSKNNKSGKLVSESSESEQELFSEQQYKEQCSENYLGYGFQSNIRNASWTKDMEFQRRYKDVFCSEHCHCEILSCANKQRNSELFDDFCQKVREDRFVEVNTEILCDLHQKDSYPEIHEALACLHKKYTNDFCDFHDAVRKHGDSLRHVTDAKDGLSEKAIAQSQEIHKSPVTSHKEKGNNGNVRYSNSKEETGYTDSDRMVVGEFSDSRSGYSGKITYSKDNRMLKRESSGSQNDSMRLLEPDKVLEIRLKGFLDLPKENNTGPGQNEETSSSGHTTEGDYQQAADNNISDKQSGKQCSIISLSEFPVVPAEDRNVHSEQSTSEIATMQDKEHSIPDSERTQKGYFLTDPEAQHSSQDTYRSVKVCLSGLQERDSPQDIEETEKGCLLSETVLAVHEPRNFQTSSEQVSKPAIEFPTTQNKDIDLAFSLVADVPCPAERLHDLLFIANVLISSGFAGNDDVSLIKSGSSVYQLNPLIYERLEECYKESTLQKKSTEKETDMGGNDTEGEACESISEEHLLFDFINETLLEILRPYYDPRPWIAPKNARFCPIPTSKKLLEQIWHKICSHLYLQIESQQELETLISKDLRNTEWIESQEVHETIGNEIDQLIFDDLIQELSSDLAISERGFHLC